MAYLNFSTSSASILGHAETIEAARAHGDSEFTVILECPLAEAQKLNSWDMPRRNMPVVYRGANDLAQFFRRAR